MTTIVVTIIIVSINVLLSDLTAMKSVDKTRKQVGEKLRELRIKKGYPNYEVFAYTHNISKYVIFKAENGLGITFESFLRILFALEVSLEEFSKGIK
jgi:hypothetical protein